MPMSLFHEGVCYRCGSSFIMNDPDQWVYRSYVDKKSRLFCSWACMQAARKEEEERRKNDSKRGKHKT